MSKLLSGVGSVQRTVGAIVLELRSLDRRLEVLAGEMVAMDDAILPAELQAGVQCVRSELLSDAIETLSALATLTEETAQQRRVEVLAVAERIAAFG